MRRELKFRAWNKSMKLFFKWNLTFSFNGTSKVWGDIEQYTGKKDDDGKEIYENDIVTNTIIKKQFIVPKKKGINSYYRNMPITTKTVVRWDDHWARWIFTNGIEIGKLKIIGNKHQNPELL